MNYEPKYRHELKYIITYADYLAIKQRLCTVMKKDKHVGTDGKYVIRSLYLDNIDDKALREKLYGIQCREKFRIRYYNNDMSYITLEKKMKHNSLCMKFSEQITKAEYENLLDGDLSWMIDHPAELVREIYCKMKYRQLKPKVFVTYVREPFVYEPGNVRITFDSCIRSSLFQKIEKEKTIYDISAADNPGDIVLEVKYDEFLPEPIESMLQTGSLRVQAFSKYGICRRFG